MKKLLFTLILLCSIVGLKAQSISHIETTKAWYYIYDQDGKKIKTLSTSQGELKGYSSTFYIIKQGSAFYVLRPLVRSWLCRVTCSLVARGCGSKEGKKKISTRAAE